MARKIKKKNSKKPKNSFSNSHHGTSNEELEFAKLVTMNFDKLLEKQLLDHPVPDGKIKERVLEAIKKTNEPENDAFNVDLIIHNNSIANEIIVPKLVIQIQPGTAPEDEIASILADISLLYRKMGGSGIEFKLDGVEIKKEELV